MSTDWRALATELAAELERCRPLAEVPDCLARARASLTADGPAVPEGREPASVVGEPSDEELLALVPQGSESDFYLPQGLPSDWVDGDFIAPPEAVVAFARAVLTRFGHQPAPAADDSTLRDAALLALTTLEGWSNYDQWVWPISAMEQAKRGTTEALASLKQALSRPAPTAEGEVGELVAWLRDAAFDLNGSDPAKSMLTRAADLLEQRHPTPVPVAERLPELRGMFERILCVARSSGQRPVGNIQLADRLISAVVSWAALPLPQGEVQ